MLALKAWNLKSKILDFIFENLAPDSIIPHFRKRTRLNILQRFKESKLSVKGRAIKKGTALAKYIEAVWRF